MTKTFTPTRRTFLRGTALSATGVAATAMVPATRATAEAHGDTFTFEVQRSDAEWRDMLGDDYAILREGQTEEKFSSPLHDQREAGMFACKGCDLPVYDALYQEYPGIGFAFFGHSVPQSTLTSVDGTRTVSDVAIVDTTKLETHCRRCGSHLGHIVQVEGQVLHCINGASLTFTPTVI